MLDYTPPYNHRDALTNATATWNKFMTRNRNSLGVGVNLGSTEDLRDKLVAEITAYERQQAALKLNGTQVNFSMIQTYKELIHARRDMLNRLPPRF